MAIITDVQKNLTKDEVLNAWKHIDRMLGTATSDSEISGDPNEALLTADLLPLILPEDRYTTILGGLTANRLSDIQGRWEKEQHDKVRRYEKLRSAQEHPEIDGSLTIYADEATTEDQDGEIIHVSHPKEEIKDVVEDLFERTGVEDKSWKIIKSFCGYGDEYYEIVISKSGTSILKLDRLPREAIDRFEENNILKGFKIDEQRLEEDQYHHYQINYQTGAEKEEDLIYPFRILHFKISSDKYGIYGQSIIDVIVSTIEQLRMLEKSLVVARVTRAPERRVYTIDTGTLPLEKASRYANKVVSDFKNKKRLITRSDGNQQTDMQRDIFGTVEDLVIPKRAGSEGNQVTTLEQLNSAGDIADIEFIRDKIFPALGIPRQYFYDDTFANANTNLSSKSIPFAKRIRRVQRFFLHQLYKLCIIELKLKGYSNKDISELTLSMNNPSNIDDRERITIETERWGLIGAIKGLNAEKIFYPDYLIYQDFLKMNKEEIATLLKLAQLQEKGINPFEAFEYAERPEGAEELETPPIPGVPGAEGGEMGVPPMPGGEGEAPPEGEDVALPPEVEDALGPPPPPEGGAEAEVASYDIDTTGKVAILEDKKVVAEKIKDNLIKKLMSFMEHTKTEDKEEEKYQKVMKRAKRLAFSEVYFNGELSGLSDVHNNVIMYSEEEAVSLLPYHEPN